MTMNRYETTRFDRRYAGRYRDDYRDHGRDLMTSLSDAARENPVSAALIGMGILWLFMGGNRVSLLGGDGKTSLVGTVAHGTGTVAKSAAHAASRAGEAVSSTVSSTASGIAGTVSDAASRAGEYASGHVQGVDAQSAYHNANVGEYGNAMDGEMRGYGSSGASGRSRYEEGYAPIATLRHNLQDLFERHPVALGVAGLAIGVGVAASLPVTERERETLGRAGEAVRHKASETVSQAKDAARAAVDEVKSSTGTRSSI